MFYRFSCTYRYACMFRWLYAKKAGYFSYTLSHIYDICIYELCLTTDHWALHALCLKDDQFVLVLNVELKHTWGYAKKLTPLFYSQISIKG